VVGRGFNKCSSRDCGCFCGAPAVVFDRPSIEIEALARALGDRFQRVGYLVIWFSENGHRDYEFFTLRPSAPALLLRCLNNEYRIHFVYTIDTFVTRVARELSITVIPWSVFRNVKVPKPTKVDLPIPKRPPVVFDYE
jgi:hypothetical protein